MLETLVSIMPLVSLVFALVAIPVAIFFLALTWKYSRQTVWYNTSSKYLLKGYSKEKAHRLATEELEYGESGWR